MTDQLHASDLRRRLAADGLTDYDDLLARLEAAGVGQESPDRSGRAPADR